MKLEYVVTATNLNEAYLSFIPLFCKTWKKLYPLVKVVIVMISDTIPDKFVAYQNSIYLFPPIPEVSTVFTSQFIRLLYPCLLQSKGGVLVTDIDMIPMNREYFTSSIASASDNQFVYLRGNVLDNKQQMAICYNVAHSSTWREVFQIESEEDIRTRFLDIQNSRDISWFTDQLLLYEYVMRWNAREKRLLRVFDNVTGFNRLRCRSNELSRYIIRKNISSGKYTDYHCAKPYSKYSKINSRIYFLLY